MYNLIWRLTLEIEEIRDGVVLWKAWMGKR
jgi:hypothetical protein